MKKSAWVFIFSTSLLGACSTTKNNAVTSNLNQPQVTTNTPEKVQHTLVSKSGKNVPIPEAQLMAVPARPLNKKTSGKTMEDMFDAATVKKENAAKN